MTDNISYTQHQKEDTKMQHIGKSLMLTLTMTLTACGSGHDSTGFDVTIPSITGDSALDEYVKFASEIQGVPYIRVAYADLNPTDTDNVILGNFYGQTPAEKSYIYFDTGLKTDDYSVIVGGQKFVMTDDRLKIWVAGHEVCHYNQWINGQRFNEGYLPHDERSYEIACNLWGDTVLRNWENSHKAD